jgi:hypothetical protein
MLRIRKFCRTSAPTRTTPRLTSGASTLHCGAAYSGPARPRSVPHRIAERPRRHVHHAADDVRAILGPRLTISFVFPVALSAGEYVHYVGTQSNKAMVFGRHIAFNRHGLSAARLPVTQIALSPVAFVPESKYMLLRLDGIRRFH